MLLKCYTFVSKSTVVFSGSCLSFVQIKKNGDKYYKGAGRGCIHQRELCHCVVKTPQIVASQICCFSGLPRSLAGDLRLQRILKVRGAGKFTQAIANNANRSKDEHKQANKNSDTSNKISLKQLFSPGGGVSIPPLLILKPPFNEDLLWFSSLRGEKRLSR